MDGLGSKDGCAIRFGTRHMCSRKMALAAPKKRFTATAHNSQTFTITAE